MRFNDPSGHGASCNKKTKHCAGTVVVNNSSEPILVRGERLNTKTKKVEIATVEVAANHKSTDYGIVDADEVFVKGKKGGKWDKDTLQARPPKFSSGITGSYSVTDDVTSAARGTLIVRSGRGGISTQSIAPWGGADQNLIKNIETGNCSDCYVPDLVPESFLVNHQWFGIESDFVEYEVNETWQVGK